MTDIRRQMSEALFWKFAVQTAAARVEDRGQRSEISGAPLEACGTNCDRQTIGVKGIRGGGRSCY